MVKDVFLFPGDLKTLDISDHACIAHGTWSRDTFKGLHYALGLANSELKHGESEREREGLTIMMSVQVWNKQKNYTG